MERFRTWHEILMERLSEILPEETDPNKLYNLQSQLDGFTLYDENTLEQFCKIFYDADKPDELLHAILDAVVEKWLELELYTKLSKPDINADLKRKLYKDYLEQTRCCA